MVLSQECSVTDIHLQNLYNDIENFFL